MKWFSVIFTGIGLLLLGISALSYWQAKKFMAASVTTQGRVVDYEYLRSGSGSETHYNYYPVVAFRTQSGDSVHFTGSTGKSRKGKTGIAVSVRYKPGKPGSARVDSFWKRWAGTWITGALAVVFGGTGLLVMYFRWRKAKRKRWLQHYGKRIRAKLESVEEDGSTYNSSKGHPYVVRCTAEIDGQQYYFESASVWQDPSPKIKDNQVDVLIDPQNPSRYHVDIE